MSNGLRQPFCVGEFSTCGGNSPPKSPVNALFLAHYVGCGIALSIACSEFTDVRSRVQLFSGAPMERLANPD